MSGFLKSRFVLGFKRIAFALASPSLPEPSRTAKPQSAPAPRTPRHCRNQGKRRRIGGPSYLHLGLSMARRARGIDNSPKRYRTCSCTSRYRRTHAAGRRLPETTPEVAMLKPQFPVGIGILTPSFSSWSRMCKKRKYEVSVIGPA